MNSMTLDELYERYCELCFEWEAGDWNTNDPAPRYEEVARQFAIATMVELRVKQRSPIVPHSKERFVEMYSRLIKKI